jgi:hypothetical protein
MRAIGTVGENLRIDLARVAASAKYEALECATMTIPSSVSMERLIDNDPAQKRRS